MRPIASVSCAWWATCCQLAARTRYSATSAGPRAGSAWCCAGPVVQCAG
jgi:hypothetical protein